MAFPSYTKTYHTAPYPSIDPARPELSTAGKVIAITGAGSGLGTHLAHAFALSGTTSLALIGRSLPSLQSTKTSLLQLHPNIRVLTLVADIADQAAINSAFSSISQELGPIDILVSNAAYMPDLTLLRDASVEEYTKGLTTNIMGNFIVSQAFLKNKAEKESVYIHISTGGAHIPPMKVGMSAYAVSKLAASKLVEFLGVEEGVRVLNVHPGVMDTEMGKKGERAGLVLPVDDIQLPTSFVVWATSPEAEFLNGKFVWANWDVDELIAKKEELASSPQLTLGLLGWP